MKKNRRVVFSEMGNPEVLSVDMAPVPTPADHQVRVRHEAIGVNFIDTYHRSGLYKVALPSGLGLEGAGIVDAVGAAVSGVQVGDRVAYCGGPIGAYSDFHCVAANRLLLLPDEISCAQAASIMLKGLTAASLLFEVASLKAGDWILVPAAAGGVGQLLCQWASKIGVRVIGTVGSPNKVETAEKCGCENVLLYRSEDVPAAVKSMTGGRGVKAVFDGVGKDTFLTSLDCLQPRGLMVSFGNASGPVADFSPLLLTQKGSLFLTRPSLAHYMADTADFQKLCGSLLEAYQRGWIQARIGGEFSLAQAGAAHQLLESGASQGALLLIP